MDHSIRAITTISLFLASPLPSPYGGPWTLRSPFSNCGKYTYFDHITMQNLRFTVLGLFAFNNDAENISCCAGAFLAYPGLGLGLRIRTNGLECGVYAADARNLLSARAKSKRLGDCERRRSGRSKSTAHRSRLIRFAHPCSRRHVAHKEEIAQ